MHRIHYFSSLLIALFLLAGCSDVDPFVEGSTAGTSSNAIAQKNFALYASDLNPSIFATPDANSSYTYTELQFTIRIGDNDNQTISGAHLVRFKTEWGLIDPSCTTKDGTCTVNWQTTSNPPSDHRTTIVAYAVGEESFFDDNGNGSYDDGEVFIDNEEPFLDTDIDWVFTNGIDIPINVVNGNDPTGTNTSHDIGDGFYNGKNCTHTSLCSTLKTVYVWDQIEINMDGGVTTKTIGGTVSGVSGSGLVLQTMQPMILRSQGTGTSPFRPRLLPATLMTLLS